VNLAFALLVGAAVCPAPSPAPDALGVSAIGKVPASSTMQQNSDGKQLYRQERWQEAREKYRAALAADPEFLGAQLNIACSFSRQQRYVEAADEAAKLIRTAFVPWNREVREAADLGILQDQSVYAKIEAATTEAAQAWGAEALRGIPLVARTKPPLKTTGEGVLVLGLNQEAFAWVPKTGRFLQLTAEDGRVLALAVSDSGRSMVYILGGKLVRTPGQMDLLRGLSVRVLDLATSTLGKPIPLPGDVTKVQIAYAVHPAVRLFGESSAASFQVRDSELQATLAPMPARSVELTPSGVKPAQRLVKKPCSMTLAPRLDEKGIWRIRRIVKRGKSSELDTRYGAGLFGLPFPDGATASGGRL
jgi:hypothetical protein